MSSELLNIVPFTLPIQPFTHPVCGEVHLPGSKSITNRALVLAALSPNRIILENALFSEDTLVMVKALQDLGFSIQTNFSETVIDIQGEGGWIPSSSATIDVGSAGTVARFLVAFLSLKKGGEYRLDGSESMRKRPMKPLLDALEKIGAIKVYYHEQEGHFPFTIKTRGLESGVIEVDASQSGQFLSALLMIGSLVPGELIIRTTGNIVSKSFVRMTLSMISEFGGKMPEFEWGSRGYVFRSSRGYDFKNRNYLIEPDATAASYFLALPLVVGGQLTLHGLTIDSTKQNDINFSYIVEKLGLNIQKTDQYWYIEKVKKPRINITDTDFSEISDTFLTLAAIAPLLGDPISIRGIAHTQWQETDRMYAVATELMKLGQLVDRTRDALLIRPQSLRPSSIETYEDHRMAMSFAILGCFDLFETGESWLSIDNPYCCSKTFPGFFDTLDKLRTFSTR